MTITARSITTNNTLEQLRNQFNNLVADVDGLETGTKAFSTITSTTSSSTTINVLEDGTIVFEGATDDNFETTLTAADPTADRTITFPDSSGTVVVSGTGGLTVADGGNIGSDSDTDAISISATGVVSFSATTANTNASDGAVTVAGGVGIAADLSVGDDLRLISDSAVLSFGADSDVTITHDPDDGLFLKSTATGDDNPFVLTLQTGETDIAANDVLGQIDFQAPDEGTGTDAILVAAGIAAVSEGDFSSSSNATKLSFKTGASEAASEKMSLSSGGNLTVSGTFTGGGLMTTGGNIVIPNAGNIGSASDTDAIAISSSGVVTISTDTDSTSSTSGALVVHSIGVADDLFVGDDIELGGGVLAIKNTGAQSQARFYCESSNAHYAAIQAPAHADFSGNVVLTLPATTGNLVTSAAAADEATALAIALG